MGCSTGENASLAAEVPTEIDNRLASSTLLDRPTPSMQRLALGVDV
jgi:hypothetical protein